VGSAAVSGATAGAAGGAASFLTASALHGSALSTGGRFSWGGLGRAMAMGAVGGAIGGGAGVAAGGEFLGAMTGGVSGAAGGYGMGLAFGAEFSTESLLFSIGGGVAGAVAGSTVGRQLGNAIEDRSQGPISYYDNDGQCAIGPNWEAIQLAKEHHRAEGNVSEVELDGLPVRIYGANPVNRQNAIMAIERVFGTARGGVLLDAFKGRVDLNGQVLALDVTLTTGSAAGSLSILGGQDIVLDILDTFMRYAPSVPYRAEYSSLERVFAHEVGHAYGTPEGSVDGMLNVTLNENPIMRELGNFNDRSAY
jgi:hypothetical protein